MSISIDLQLVLADQHAQFCHQRPWPNQLAWNEDWLVTVARPCLCCNHSTCQSETNRQFGAFWGGCLALLMCFMKYCQAPAWGRSMASWKSTSGLFWQSCTPWCHDFFCHQQHAEVVHVTMSLWPMEPARGSLLAEPQAADTHELWRQLTYVTDQTCGSSQMLKMVHYQTHPMPADKE